MRIIVLAISAASTLLVSAAFAQTLRPQLDYATAAAIRDGCLDWAKNEHLSVSVAVYNQQGVLISQALMDGAPAGVVEIAQWKGRSAAIFESKGSVTAEWGTAPGLASMAGGVSFATADGAMLGGVGTSGASPEQDEACSMAGIARAGLIAQDTP